jgi:hypothetical protein
MAYASFPARQGAAAKLAENPAFLELRVRALAGGPRSFAWARLAFPACTSPGTGSSPRYCPVIALAGQRDQAGFLQFVQHVPGPLRLLSCTDPGSAPDTHRMCPSEPAMTCRFIPCFLCTARVKRPVRGDPVDRDERAAEDHAGVPSPLRAAVASGHGRRAVPRSRSRISRPWSRRCRIRPPARRTSRPCAAATVCPANCASARLAGRPARDYGTDGCTCFPAR